MADRINAGASSWLDTRIPLLVPVHQSNNL